MELTALLPPMGLAVRACGAAVKDHYDGQIMNGDASQHNATNHGFHSVRLESETAGSLQKK